MSYASYPGRPSLRWAFPVKVFNPLNGKSVEINSELDTASWTQFDTSYATDLGLDVTKGYHYFTRGDEKYWLHRLPIQVGNTNPTIADVYFGSKAGTHSTVKSSEVGRTGLSAFGWANNGGASHYIIDMSFERLNFTDYSYINSLPNPVNDYTIVPLSPPRRNSLWKDEILYNQAPYHFITFYNKRTNQPVNIRVLLDSAAVSTTLHKEYAPMLGINDIESGRPGTLGDLLTPVTLYRHDIMIKIGTLKPHKISVSFTGPDEEDFPTNLFGYTQFLDYKVRFMKDRILYEEIETPWEKFANK
jgi:hypothetical protein